MATKQEARRAIQKRFGGKQDALPAWPAFLGNEDGTVQGSQSDKVYVRYPTITSAAVEVYNFGVPLVAGLRVMVGSRPENPTKIGALGVSDVRIDADTSPVYGVIGPHASQHAWYGGDPVYINWRQITPLGVYPTNPASLSIQVQPGYIPRPGADVAVDYQTVDLTSSVPVSGARYSLISLDSTGTVVVTDGSINSGGFSALTTADIPDTPAGNWRSAAIVMYAGQTAIVETTSEIDIYDLRFPEEFIAGSITPSNIPLTDDHILVGSASNVAADVAMSGDAAIVSDGTLTLATVNADVGTFGDETHLPQITVDSKGRITAIDEIAFSSGEVLMAEGITPPSPLFTEDETDWLYTE